MVHYGEAEDVLAHRNNVFAEAFKRHPERFKYHLPEAGQLPSEVWINPPKVENLEADYLDLVG